MTDQDHGLSILVMAPRIDMDFGYQRASRIDMDHIALLGFRRHRFGHSMGGKYHRKSFRYLVKLLNEHGTLSAEFIHDIFIVDDFMSYIDGRPELLDRLFDNFNGAVHAGAETARAGEQGKGFSPASWLEQSGNTMGISESIKSIQERGVERHDYYQAQKVELVLDDIDLVKLVELLHTLQEAPQAMRINDVRVKTDRKVRSNLDIRMEIAVLKPLDDA